MAFTDDFYSSDAIRARNEDSHERFLTSQRDHVKPSVSYRPTTPEEWRERFGTAAFVVLVGGLFVLYVLAVTYLPTPLASLVHNVAKFVLIGVLGLAAVWIAIRVVVLVAKALFGAVLLGLALVLAAVVYAVASKVVTWF
jgi:hypothetical protein